MRILALQMYVFSLPLQPAWSLHQYLPIPLLAGFLFLFACLINRRPISLTLIAGCAFGLLFGTWILSLVQYILIDFIQLWHLAAFSVVLSVGYLAPVVFLGADDQQHVRSATTAAFVFVSIIGLCFFAIENLTDLDPFKWLAIPEDYKYSSGQVFGFLKRAHSVFQEPAYFAWYLLCAFPYVWQFVQGKNILRRVVFGLFFSNMMLTFSAVGNSAIIVCVATSFLIYLFFRRFARRLAIIALIFSPIYIAMIYGLMTIGLNKFVGTSGLERAERWNVTRHAFLDSPLFGHGFGYIVSQHNHGSLSFTLQLFAELGLVFGALFLTIFILTFKSIWKRQVSPSSTFVLTGSIFGSLLFFSTNNAYYLIFPWFYLASAVRCFGFSTGGPQESLKSGAKCT